VLCVSLIVAGCGQKPPPGPETVPLSGKIVMTKGGSVRDLNDHGIFIQFECVEQPEMQAFGEILEDGTFTMATQVESRGKSGVIPGTHRVRLNADDTAARFVAQKFLNYATSGITIKAPPEKDILIEVWR
jgi:hypothetical protein